MKSERSPTRRGLFLFALFPLFFSLSCRDGDPVGLDTSDLQIHVVRGNGQASEPSSLLPVPLEIQVQKRGNGAPVEGVSVRWEMTAGVGAVVDPSTSETDSLGLTFVNLTLGPELGTYGLQASIKGMESPPVQFSADAILVPVLNQVPAGPVAGGDLVSLEGTNFSPDPELNVVTFSNVRARVLSATPEELQVEVPSCLPAREYLVRVQVGALPTTSSPIQVTGSPESLDLGPGEDRVLDASAGLGCFHLSSATGGLFLVVPHSTSAIGGTEHGFSLTALTSDGRTPSGPEHQPSLSGEVRDDLGAQERWDERVRGLESGLLKAPEYVPGSYVPAPPPGTGPSLVPDLGDQRNFKVLNSREKFDRVTARLRFVTDHSLVYVDERVPGGGFTDQDFSALALEFENAIYPTVTEAFGSESDVDENERVIILFTAAVNRLTGSDDDGYVGGFFYGLDLLEGQSGSNEGEIFYAMVPDPDGQEGPKISRFAALQTIPAILAHEFEHMVHFNQRILVGGAPATETLWLSEAMAQMAEDLVGMSFGGAQQSSKAQQYQSGNFGRARRFVEDPSQVSVLASFPPGTLAERGAGWLLLKHVYGRPGREGLLGSLATSSSSGIDNLTEASGVEWRSLLADWAGSLFVDGTTIPVRPELKMAGVDLRVALAQGQGTYPLQTRPFGSYSALFSGSLWSSAPDYFIISPPADGGVALSAGGLMGGVPEAALGLQVLVVRIQ